MALLLVEPKLTREKVGKILLEQYDLELCAPVKTLSEQDPSAITYCSNSFVAKVKEHSNSDQVSIILKEGLMEGINQDFIYREIKADVVDFLLSKKVPVAKHYRTNTNVAFGDHDGHLIEVLQYFPNVRNYEFGNERDVLQAARSLARFNWASSLLSKEKPEIFRKLEKRKDLYGTTLDDVSFTLERREELVEILTESMNPFKGSKKDIDPFFKDVEKIKEEWSKGGNDESRLAVVHRDFHGNNAIFQKERGKLKAILDFDTICVMDKAYDLGYSGLFFSSCIPKPFQKPDSKLFSLFGENYLQERRRLSEGKDLFISEPVESLDRIRQDIVNRTVYFILAKYFKGEQYLDAVIANHVGIHKRMRDLETKLKS